MGSAGSQWSGRAKLPAMKLNQAVLLALVFAGCKESAQEVEDPTLPIMVYYALPG